MVLSLLTKMFSNNLSTRKLVKKIDVPIGSRLFFNNNDFVEEEENLMILLRLRSNCMVVSW